MAVDANFERLVALGDQAAAIAGEFAALSLDEQRALAVPSDARRETGSSWSRSARSPRA